MTIPVPNVECTREVTWIYQDLTSTRAGRAKEAANREVAAASNGLGGNGQL